MASSSTGPSGGIEATLKVPREDLGYDAMMALVQEVQAAIASSAAGTLNGLREDLELVLANPRHDQLRSGADMLRLRLMNCTSGRQSISELREAMLSSCQQYMSRAAQGNDSTVNYVLPFIRDTSVVIAHGCGALLAHCVASSISLRTGVRFLVTEGLPGDTGRLLEDRVRTQPAIAKMEERMGREAFDALFARSFAIVPDSSVATLMEHADLVLCGAHAVTEHGGLVHTTGSLQLGMITNAMSVPFYVLCEEFKFSSIFPLSTPDLYRDASKNGRLRSALSATSLPDVATPTAQTPSEQASSPTKQFGRLFGRPQSFGSLSTLDATAVSEAGGKAPVVLWPVELVPPKLVTFIFSEDGIMPPSAVADQMLQARRAAATGVRE